MKRKVILALLATMTLTVGSLGTAFAMNSTPTIELQTNEIFKQAENPEVHTHVWGDAYYVKDADAVYSEPEWIVDKEAEYEQIKVVDQEAWDQPVYKTVNICFDCYEKGTIVDMDALYAQGGTAFDDHVMSHILAGEGGSYGEKEIQVDTIHHDEVFHYENGALISPEEGHWTEAQLISPEKGHWEHKCADCGITENCSAPGTVIPGDPDTDENTDKPGDTTENTGGNTQTSGDNTGNTDENTQKPGTSTGDNSQTTTGDNTQISTGDNAQTSTGNNSQTTTDDKTQSGNENTSNTENTENKSEDQKQNENKETTTADSKVQKKDDTTVTVSTEKKAPKTGDTASLIYLATLAGSAVTGGTAFGLRKKLKK